MQTRGFKFLVCLFTLAVVMACVPSLRSAPPASPPLDQNSIDRIIAQTANAASSQTALAQPTNTPTNTNTPRPRGTNTPEPTITETFVFLFETPTVFILPPTLQGFTPTTNKDYLCEVLDRPKNGEYYNPRVKFTVRWRLKNIGRMEWDRKETDFFYDSGDKFHRVAGYDLTKTTGIGDVAEFFVEMQAPKDPGTYTTFWTMAIGPEKFCRVSLKIIVVPLE